jgi:hypothetical protein
MIEGQALEKGPMAGMAILPSTIKSSFDFSSCCKMQLTQLEEPSLVFCKDHGSSRRRTVFKSVSEIYSD